jgi:putative Mn2+ efflux pump MntP
MSFPTLFLVAVGLSMDDFGAFALLFPVLGWGLGFYFREIVTDWDHWIAFGLLAIVGIVMIVEGLRHGRDGKKRPPLSALALLTLAIATNIDEAAIGVTLAFLDTAIVSAALILGAVTFATAAVGVHMGRIFGPLLGKKAEIVGGLVLIGLGVKILLEDIWV